MKDLILFQTALFAMFSPFAVIGPYGTLTEGMSRPIKRRVSFRVGLYTAITLLIIAWSGDFILRILGISVAALGAAGGLVLIVSALPMVLTGESPRKKVSPREDEEECVPQEEADEDWKSMIVTPLVFPMTMGAGTISLVITQTGLAVSIMDRGVIGLAVILHGIIVSATYFFADPLTSRLGGQGSSVVTRIGGIILLCLAFIIFTNGLKILLPGLT